MAKKTILKPETLKRLRRIINDKGGIKKYSMDKFLENETYLNLYDTYMNGFEKSIAINVIDLIYEGRTDDEIQLLVREMKTDDDKASNDDICGEIENETAAMFIKSQNKVVEGPIVVEVSDQSDKTETDNTNVDSVNDDSSVSDTDFVEDVSSSQPTLFMSKDKSVIDVDDFVDESKSEYTTADIGKVIKDDKGDIHIIGPIGACVYDEINKVLENNGDPILKYKVVNY